MRTLRDHNGFTLVEVLVAASLVAFTLIASYQLFARTLQHHAHNTHLLRAIAIGHSLSETLWIIDGMAPPADRDCEAGDPAACRRVDQVANALDAHHRQAELLLPGGRMTSSRGGDGRLRVTLNWDSGVPLTPGVFRLEILP